jgi:hypothetical protein
MNKKARKSTTKRPSSPKKPPKQDFAQNALASVEKAIGGKLADGMKRTN